MNQTEITAAVRRGIREPSPITVSDTQITAVTIRGVEVLGLEIKAVAPSFYNERALLTSNTHVFSWPTDCETILKVWDLKTNASIVSGAADNGSGLVRLTTSAVHGLAADDIIRVYGVAGTTEANGSWKVSAVPTTTTIDLTGSTFANTYSSGGYVYQEPTKFYEIEKINFDRISNRDDTQWYAQGKNIVINDPDFSNDLIVDYVAIPTAITDIPSEYHQYLVSFCVVDLIEVPNPGQPDYADKAGQLKYHRGLVDKFEAYIRRTLKESTEPTQFDQEIDFDALAID